MTVLLTGGTGFLGSHIAALLNKDGIKIRAIARKTSNTAFLKQLPNVELFNLSMSDMVALKEAVKGVDAIIHSAALIKAINLEEYMRVNAGYTENLIESVVATGTQLKRFVLVSSVAAAGLSPPGEILVNSCTPNPVSFYGRSKLAAEKVALKYKDQIPITILRPSSLYGPRDKAVLILYRCIKTGFMPYCGSPNTKLVFLHGEDCARACIRAIYAEVPSGSAYFLDDGNVYTWKIVLSAIEKSLGVKAFMRFPIPKGIIYLVALGMDIYVKFSKKAILLSRNKMNELYGEFVTDSSDSQKVLDWIPQINLEDGLRQTVSWYKENNFL